MKWKNWTKMAVALGMAFFLGATSLPVNAYFDRGDVSVSLGTGSISLEEGETTNVSVKVSPSSSTQLPGCGMAECPQICGEKDCLNAKGECTCGGTTYDTYYADVSASSSDSSVAAATYSGGTLKIKAVGRGTAKITVTGSLRQYSDGKASLSVTVSSSSSIQSSTEQKAPEATKETTVSKKTTTETKKKSTAAKASKKTKKTKKTTEKGIEKTTEETTKETTKEMTGQRTKKASEEITEITTERGALTTTAEKEKTKAISETAEEPQDVLKEKENREKETRTEKTVRAEEEQSEEELSGNRGQTRWILVGGVGIIAAVVGLGGLLFHRLRKKK